MNEQQIRETLHDLANDVQPWPSLADVALRQARRRRYTRRVAVAGGAAAALVGVVYAPTALTGQPSNLDPADGTTPGGTGATMSPTPAPTRLDRTGSPTPAPRPPHQTGTPTPAPSTAEPTEVPAGP